MNKTIAISIIGLTYLLLFTTSCATSKNNSRFEGKLVYELFIGEEAKQPSDSSKYQIIYAKDSLLRTENYTPLGKQVFIKHITKNKAYTLVNLFDQKYAIQSIPDSLDKLSEKYSFEYKRGKKNIAGRKANRVLVQIIDQPAPVEMFYFNDISHDYSSAIPGLNGLPAEYTIFVKGEKLHYKLVTIEERAIPIDTFGIPSDYIKISVTDFMNLIQVEKPE
ncbi:MAG: hypothetical protein ACPGU5_07195 [Lishizhenia sp.]